MKNFKKLMMLTILAISGQQAIFAYNDEADDAEPRHQGFGRIWASTKQIATLHPIEGTENLVTGDQPDTTFGWHENENGRMQANNARTKRNKNTPEQQKARKKAQDKKKKQQQKKKKQQQQKNKKSSRKKSQSADDMNMQ